MEWIDGHVVRGEQPLAIELVSTIHVVDGSVVDALTSTAQLRDWLRINRDRLGGVEPGPLEGILPKLRTLRDALRGLFVAATDGVAPATDDLETVNAMSRRAPSHLELRWPRSGGPTAMISTEAVADDVLLASLARDAIEVLIGVHGELLACGGPSCVLYFVRTHPRQAWCSAGCGNRARVARHYWRSRAGR